MTHVDKSLLAEINSLKDTDRARHSQRFFKTGKGEYGEGDIFLGLTVPMMRKISKNYKDLKLSDVQRLLQSKYHEYRLIALFIATLQFEKGDESTKEEIFKFYIHNTNYINNWDLVDCSAHKIVGAYLKDKNRSMLYDFAKSDLLWERRIAVISTFAFIKDNDLVETLAISELLLNDSHDLIHKAVGWGLREVGKMDEKVLIHFLDKHASDMPRTMLRYSLEKLSSEKRIHYMSIK